MNILFSWFITTGNTRGSSGDSTFGTRYNIKFMFFRTSVGYFMLLAVGDLDMAAARIGVFIWGRGSFSTESGLSTRNRSSRNDRFWGGAVTGHVTWNFCCKGGKCLSSQDG